MPFISFPSGSTKQAAIRWTLFWIFLALLFSGGVYYVYGKEAFLQFLAGFILEKSISLDNIFIIALTFSTFAVPLNYQQRVLTWGLIGILFLRMLVILAGTALWTHFSWMHHLFGVLLLFSALRMAATKLQPITPENHPLIAYAMKKNWVSSTFEKDFFFVKKKNRWLMTPLFIMLLLVASSNLLFALDSIPAIFAVTQEPFIVFTSNFFALLGLRSLYFALAHWMHRLFYFKISLVFLLVLLAIKMFMIHLLFLPTAHMLLTIIAVLGTGLLASSLAKERAAPLLPSPLAEEVEKITSTATRQLQRLLIIALGLTVLLIGLAMIVLPGPAILVIPLGLAILAHEFPPAKKLLNWLVKTFKQVWRRWF